MILAQIRNPKDGRERNNRQGFRYNFGRIPLYEKHAQKTG